MGNTYNEDGGRIGPVIGGPDGEEMYLSRGRWHLGTAAGEKEIEPWEAAALAAQWGETLPA